MNQLHQKLDKSMINCTDIDDIAMKKLHVLVHELHTFPKTTFPRKTVSIEDYGLMIQILHRLTDLETAIVLHAAQLPKRVVATEKTPLFDMKQFLNLFVMKKSKCSISFNNLLRLHASLTMMKPKNKQEWIKILNNHYHDSFNIKRSVTNMSIFGRLIETQNKEDINQVIKGLSFRWPNKWTMPVKLDILELDHLPLTTQTIKIICHGCTKKVVYDVYCERCLWSDIWCVEKRVSTIPEAGYGLFTTKIMYKKKRLPYDGEIVPRWKQVKSDYACHLLKNLTVDSQHSRWKWCASRYINHSSNPNCRFVVTNDRQIFVESLEDILPNTELFLDYGKDFHF
jgi:hypothetical protein